MAFLNLSCWVTDVHASFIEVGKGDAARAEHRTRSNRDARSDKCFGRDPATSRKSDWFRYKLEVFVVDFVATCTEKSSLRNQRTLLYDDDGLVVTVDPLGDQRAVFHDEVAWQPHTRRAANINRLAECRSESDK